MDPFLQKAPSEQKLFIQEAAARTGKSEIVIEKDFWVCWVLGQIFALPEIGEHLTFKGGTSLSKAYALIDRFSEDIDISFHREFLGFGGEKDPANQQSNKAVGRQLEALRQSCIDTVRERFVPALKEQIGRQHLLHEWDLEIDSMDPQNVFFHYPRADTSRAPGYVQPSVKIELGARSDHWPLERKSIRSYLNEAFPTQLPGSGCCEVNVLAAERTFWEKATILHAEFHRPAATPTPPRHSRHYYDLSLLAQADIAAKALARLDLLDAVAEHKSVFFRSGWAHYDMAKAGTLRLVPPAERRGELERDYEAMNEMFFSTPPRFEQVLDVLAALERKINGA